jgi:hypothetical protein
MLGVEPRVQVSVDSFDAVPVHEALWWHPARSGDAAHRWLREIAARAGPLVSRRAPEEKAATERARLPPFPPVARGCHS